MEIFESHGVVTNSDSQWEKLCDLIVEYIYDIQLGLNADPFYDPNSPVITLNNVTSYYKCKYHETISVDLIPAWLNKFEITLNENNRSHGSFLASQSKLEENGKLTFYIIVKDAVGKTPDQFFDTLIHEFRHAYTRWIEMTNNISIHKKKDLQIYRQVSKLFRTYETKVPEISEKIDIDFLILDEKIFDDPIKIAQIITASFYLTDVDEMNSFLQEYQASMKKQIKENESDIKNDLKNNREKKVLLNVNISPYKNYYFKRFKSYQMFWQQIAKIDETTAENAIDQLKKIIRLYLDLKVGSKLIKFDGDATYILNKVKSKILPKFNNMVEKMNRIFGLAIQDLQNEYPFQ